MHRTHGTTSMLAMGLLAAPLLACGPQVRILDQGGPDGPSKEQVVRKCETMQFDETKGSVVQTLDAAGLVRVRIIPAKQSSKTKLSQLGSRRGRIIAKVINEGTGDWPKMALTGNSTSCWYVWGDRSDDRLRAKFVPLAAGAEAVEAEFDIIFQDINHQTDSSEWNRPYNVSHQAEPGALFQLASASPQAAIVNTGWTTCLINGCCRSRQ